MVFSNNLLMGAAGQSSGYEIEQSIRFDMTTTLAPICTGTYNAAQTDTKKLDLSQLWIKRGNMSLAEQILGLLSGGASTGHLVALILHLGRWLLLLR